MLGGVPTPLDPFEARRLVLTLLVLSAYANAEAAPVERRAPAPKSGTAVSYGRRGAGRRVQVRPPRAC
jgi:hypothetical protein